MKIIDVDADMDMGPIDVELIGAFESELGIQFPKEYKDLMTKHNPLWPENRNFDFRFKGQDDVRDVTFFGYGKHLKDYERINQFQDHDIYGRDGVVVIGESANGDYICFDYRSNIESKNPPVVLMLHDYYDEDEKMFVCPVTDTFEEFIDSLYKLVSRPGINGVRLD